MEKKSNTPELDGFHPLGPRVIIRHIDTEVKTAGGIIVSGGEIEPGKYSLGEVMKVSKWIKEPNVKPGYRVTYHKMKVEQLTLDNKTYLMTHHDDIIAING